MLHFHANVFAVPSQLSRGPTIELRGQRFEALVSSNGGPPSFDRPLASTFEQIQQNLLSVSRMDVEPDGYFLVAGGEQEGSRWQIDGHMFEYDGLMHRIEMHGSCSESTLDELLGAISTQPVVFQLVHEGVTLAGDDFRRFAKLSPG